MKWYKDGITWGGPQDDWYCFFWWNWLPKEYRYIGYSQDWYDGPLSSFGLWFINLTWNFAFTAHNGEKSFAYYSKKPVDIKKE